MHTTKIMNAVKIMWHWMPKNESFDYTNHVNNQPKSFIQSQSCSQPNSCTQENLCTQPKLHTQPKSIHTQCIQNYDHDHNQNYTNANHAHNQNHERSQNNGWQKNGRCDYTNHEYNQPRSFTRSKLSSQPSPCTQSK